MRRFLLPLLFAVTALSAQARPAKAPVPTSASAADQLTPAEARQALEVLSDDRKRNEVMATLRTVAKAGVVVDASAVASAPAAASASAVAASAPAKASAFTSNSLVAAILVQSQTWLKAAVREARNTAHAALQVSAISGWFESLISTPAGRAAFVDGLWRLVAVLVGAYAIQALVLWGLRKPRLTLRAWVDHRLASAEASGRFLAGDTLITFLAGEADMAAARAAAAAGKATPTDTTASTATADPDAAAHPGDVTLNAPAATVSSTEPIIPTHNGTASSSPLKEAPRPTHWAFLRRLPGALTLAALALLPVLTFFVVSAGLTSLLVDPDAPVRPLVLQLSNAWITAKLIMVAGRLLLAPHAPGLRLLPLDDASARFAEVWLRRIVILFVFGGALADAAADSGLSAEAHRALLRLFSLLAHLAMIMMVVRSRHVVASWIRAPEGSKEGALTSMRNWLADVWVVFAVCLIAGMWFVWALGVDDGFQKLVHILANTALILIVARVVLIVGLGMLGRTLQQNGDALSIVSQRAQHYYPLLQKVVTWVVGIVTILALLQAWGFDVLGWLRHGTLGPRLFSAAVNIGIMSLLAMLIWEVINVSVDRRIQMWSDRGDHMRTVRLRTLLPILRTTVLMVMLLIIGLTGLNQLGINTAPLLAGASIIGVALGFGSQKLVQDFITGIFLMLEDAMEVGDWVTAAGVSGSVEKLSIRTVRLRGGDGSLYIIPFSSVTTVNNVNRGLGNASVKVNVAYPTDPDKVAAALTEIAAGMRNDPKFKDAILSDFQLWGVDSVDGATITVVGQIPTTDSGRWGVQREFNRRMFKRFQELGIEIANPNRTVMVPNPNGSAPPTPASPPTAV
ncbi:hypothetical protein JCM19000A_34960 [Silvimonas sp. JCM 19000]